ncbi:MAG: thiamine pyrophosphate-dependent enzyme, partial [Acidimicrobiales bacterium]
RLLAADGRIGTLVTASSMPVRDVEWFGRSSPHFPVVHANRGANGIDGVASTAIGVAKAAINRGHVAALLGDLAFLHDLTALVRPAGHVGSGTGAPMFLVVVDNKGGGIFSFLPQASSLSEERYEQLLGTPQAVEVASVARGAGCQVVEARTKKELLLGLENVLESSGDGEMAVLVCHTSRGRNLEVHAELDDAVTKAVAAAGSR